MSLAAVRSSIALGVNIDHVATVRQARRAPYPDPLIAALLAEQSGADSITLHLREDRRHIQDRDVANMRAALQTRMNLEMAVTEEMIRIAQRVAPQDCCLVPESREEVTTEGGLDVLGLRARITDACGALESAGIRVSLFIDAEAAQVEAAPAALWGRRWWSCIPAPMPTPRVRAKPANSSGCAAPRGWPPRSG